MPEYDETGIGGLSQADEISLGQRPANPTKRSGIDVPSTPPPRSPAEAADWHMKLLDQHKTTWYLDYNRRFWDTYYGDNANVVKQGMGLSGLTATGREERIGRGEFPAESMRLEKYRIAESETVYVTPEICHVVEVMSRGMPEDMLLPEDVPFEHCIFFLGGTKFYRDWDQVNNEVLSPVAITAIQVSANQPIKHWGTDPRPGITIGLYCTADAVALPEDVDFKDSRLIMIELTGWQYNRMWSVGDRFNAELKKPDGTTVQGIMGPAIAHIRKFVLTLLRFMQEEIFQVDRERLNRAYRRRAERAGIRVPDDGAVTVVKLRKVRHVGGTEGQESRDIIWSHRWWVKGHTRHFKDGRTTWVRPYIKGPDNAPLVMKHTVYDVSR